MLVLRSPVVLPSTDCDYESSRKFAKMQIPLLSLGSEVGPEALHV